MAIKNFIKEGTYSVISSIGASKSQVSFSLDVYENESKEKKLTTLNYSLNNENKVVSIDNYVSDLSEFKEDEGTVFLFSNNTSDKQGYHVFTKKSVKGEKNSYSFVRESLHKNTPNLIKLKNKIYEYDYKENKYNEKKDISGTSIEFENYFPIGDSNHFKLAYNYLMSLPEFENCQEV